jgi:hypothetical protein
LLAAYLKYKPPVETAPADFAAACKVNEKWFRAPRRFFKNRQ